MTVQVKYIDDNILLEIPDIPPGWTIGDLKLFIQTHYHVDATLQRLVYGGKIVSDTDLVDPNRSYQYLNASLYRNIVYIRLYHENGERAYYTDVGYVRLDEVFREYNIIAFRDEVFSVEIRLHSHIYIDLSLVSDAIEIQGSEILEQDIEYLDDSGRDIRITIKFPASPLSNTTIDINVPNINVSFSVTYNFE